jgi:hypothetical protein
MAAHSDERERSEREERLRAALLAARAAQHELNNQLTLTIGLAERLAVDRALPERLRALALDAIQAAQEAAETVSRLQRITRLDEADPGAPDGPIVDLARSTD